MKFFIDTANPGEIRKAYENGSIGIEKFLPDWKKVPKK
jgi:transaldolase